MEVTRRIVHEQGENDEDDEVLDFRNDSCDNVGTGNPMHGQVIQDACKFWKDHGLAEEVDEDVFIKAFIAGKYKDPIESRIKERFRALRDSGATMPPRIPFKIKDVNDADRAMAFTEAEVVSLAGRLTPRRIGWLEEQSRIVFRFIFGKARSRQTNPGLKPGGWWSQGRLHSLRSLSAAQRHIIVTCIFGAMTQGWDQSSMAGANLTWPKESQLNSPILGTLAANPYTAESWRFGAINAAPFLSGALVALLIMDSLIRRVGRRGAIIISGIYSFGGAFGCVFVNNWWQLLICRLLLGIGMGAKAATIPVLLAEIAPTDIRGVVTVCWQLFDAFGILLGSLANIAIYNFNPDSSWRVMLLMSCLSPLVMLAMAWNCIESPRWLLKTPERGVKDALRALIQLHDRPSPIAACLELYTLRQDLVHQQNLLLPEKMGKFPVQLPQRERWELLFQRQEMRSAVYGSMAVMITQQFCGINLFAFMAATLFSNTTGQQDIDVLGYAVGFGAFNFFPTLIALKYIDMRGRRFLLNASIPSMAVFLVAIAGLLWGYNHSVTAPMGAGVTAGYLALVALFTTAYSLGLGPTAFVIAAEIFPLIIRELGMGFAVFWNFLWAGLLTLLVPVMLGNMNEPGVFLMFGLFNFGAFVACFLLVPNTRDERLENILAQLRVPPLAAVQHRILFLRWWLCHYIKWLPEVDKVDFNAYLWYKKTRPEPDRDMA